MGRVVYSTDNELDFFAKWSPEMAYVLGLLFADGSIKRKKGVVRGVTILIKSSDAEVLSNVKNLMKSSRPVLSVRNGDAVEFSISNTEFAQRLVSLGLAPRKTYNCAFPDLPSICVSHFIRGYFDGDGHVSVRVPKGRLRETIAVRIVGTQPFLSGVLSHYKNQTGNTHGSIHAHGNNLHCLSICGIDSASMFCDWIYRNSTPYTRMESKHTKYVEFMQQWRHLLRNDTKCRRSDCKIPQD